MPAFRMANLHDDSAADRFTIRRAGTGHAPALAALFRMVYRSSSHPFRSADAVETFLAEPNNFQIVAEDSGQVIASMAMVLTWC